MMSVGDDDNDNDLIKKHLLYLLYNHVFRQELKKICIIKIISMCSW